MTWFNGTLEYAELMLGLNDLKSLFQPKEFYDSKEREQVFQEGCKILRGAQYVSGRSPEQPAIADPVLRNGIGLDFQSCL